MNIDRIVIVAGIASLLGGCATYGSQSAGPIDSAALGEANRQTYAAMIINPEPVYTTDMATSGEMAAAAIERYRKGTVKQPERVRSTISTGGGSSGSGGGGGGS